MKLETQRNVSTSLRAVGDKAKELCSHIVNEVKDVCSYVSDNTCRNCVPLEQPKTRYHGKTQRGYG